MAALRLARCTIDPADAEEVLAERAASVAAIRARRSRAHPATTREGRRPDVDRCVAHQRADGHCQCVGDPKGAAGGLAGGRAGVTG